LVIFIIIFQNVVMSRVFILTTLYQYRIQLTRRTETIWISD